MGRSHTHALYVHDHSRTHRLPGHVKIVAAGAFAVVVATTANRDVVAFVGLTVLVAVVTRVARVPGRFLLTRLVVVVPFLLAALLLPFVASGPRVAVLGVPLAVDGLWGGLGMASRALLGASVSLLLIATTEVADLLRGLDRLRVPALLTAIAAFMIRYLEVIAGEVTRQRRAMTARGYDPRWMGQVRPIVKGLGGLFVRSYERGERVHQAMLARGFTGRLPRTAEERPARGADWAWALLLPAAAVAVRLVSAVMGTAAHGITT